jgi:hypothetical protein
METITLNETAYVIPSVSTLGTQMVIQCILNPLKKIQFCLQYNLFKVSQFSSILFMFHNIHNRQGNKSNKILHFTLCSH